MGRVNRGVNQLVSSHARPLNYDQKHWTGNHETGRGRRYLRTLVGQFRHYPKRVDLTSTQQDMQTILLGLSQ